MRLAHGCHVAILIAALFAGSVADAAPRRVVSTFLCTDEYVFRLLPKDRIAALSYLSADTHPVVSTIADKVKGIALIHGSAEEVLALHPDLVVMYRGTNPRLKAQLVQTKIPFLETMWANSLADIRKVTTTLGKAFGEEARAQALLDKMDAKLAAAAKATPHPPVPTLIYEPNGYATSSGVTDAILHDAGLKDMAAQLHQTRSGTVPVEAVVANPPRLLILNGGGRAPTTRADLVLKNPALRALPESTLIANMSLTPLLCPGPWSAAAALPLAELGRKARAVSSSR